MDILPEELMTIICEYLELSDIINLYLSNPIIYSKIMNKFFIKSLYKKYNCEILCKSDDILVLLEDLVHIIDSKDKTINAYYFLKQKMYLDGRYSKTYYIISFLINESTFIDVFGKDLTEYTWEKCRKDAFFDKHANVKRQRIYLSLSGWYISFAMDTGYRHNIAISHNDHDIEGVIFALLYHKVEIKLETI